MLESIDFLIVGVAALLIGSHFTFSRYGFLIKGWIKFLLSRYLSETTVEINGTSKSMTLKYERNGMKYHLTVPYERSLLSKMLDKKVYLLRNGVKTEITQQPGVPYLVSAEDVTGPGTQFLIEHVEEGITFGINNENKDMFWM